MTKVMKPSKIFVCEKCNRAFFPDLSNYANFIGGHSRCFGDLQTCVPTSAVIEMIEERIDNLKGAIYREMKGTTYPMPDYIIARCNELESLREQIEEIK